MRRLVVFLIISLFYSCRHESKGYGIIRTFVEERSNLNIDDYRYIFSLNERGTCLKCNNSFSKWIEGKLQEDSVLCIVSGIGKKVDISHLINQKNDNVIFDDDSEFPELLNLKEPAIIEVNENNIEEIINVNSSTIKSIQIIDELKKFNHFDFHNEF
ncbi:hypothetical protein SAMN05216474_2468 [Lishizhenia tianjinensis]|uniref:Lipoprotein n=1 Tax=Lishizhenia tianjinensis TaxID=477690 RepID=A0A1I7B1W2_9FLAO|nr:hypothetical protein [Lishizhenia tianjinensis]SFT81118.1 hypothetical protein SAMN05216474_2468 [Lishizhenia tianjinensis]